MSDEVGNAPETVRRLLIFARVPILGRVKTRLARTVGAEAALAAHIELVTGTLERMAGLSETVELWVDGADSSCVRAWQQRFGVRVRHQSGPDLGERMWRALQSVLAERGRPVLIGCDCPDIDATYVRRAFEVLEAQDAVIGPAEDGGYGLIGLRRPLPGLFRDMSWGSAEVLAATVERLQESAATWKLLDPIYDVDDHDDWQRYQRSRQERD